MRIREGKKHPLHPEHIAGMGDTLFLPFCPFQTPPFFVHHFFSRVLLVMGLFWYFCPVHFSSLYPVVLLACPPVYLFVSLILVARLCPVRFYEGVSPFLFMPLIRPFCG